MFVTPAPSSSDTIVTSISFTLGAASPATQADSDNLKASVATSLGVPLSSIRGWKLTAVWGAASARRRLSDATWTADFDVVIAAANVSSASTSMELASHAATQLTSSTFQSTVASNVGLSVVTPNATSDIGV